MIRITFFIILLTQLLYAGDNFDWYIPTYDLLHQEVCPIDSSADAMVVLKEVEYYIISERGFRPYLKTILKKRIKIYTESGLDHAEHKVFFSKQTDIKEIKATCFRPNGPTRELSKSDINEEYVVKDKKRDIKVKSKSFAVPGAVPGCVIDITIEIDHKNLLFLPVFRFQEDMPVLHASFKLNLPPYFTYSYVINNEGLISVRRERKELVNVGSIRGNLLFTCEADSIRALEDEQYRPPDRNLSTDIFLTLEGYNNGNNNFDFASSWSKLTSHYTEYFEKSIKSSKRARHFADSLKSLYSDADDLIEHSFKYVRDNWQNSGTWGISAPSDNVDKMMEWKALDAVDKSTILCAIFKHLDIESEVVWICTENSDYSPVSLPMLTMFDHAMVILPAHGIYLDPSDFGSEVNSLDYSLSKRFMCRPMYDDASPIGHTREFEKLFGTMVDLHLAIGDNNSLSGTGTISFYNQAAIDIKRDFRTNSQAELKEIISGYIFSERDCMVDSVEAVDDSLAPPDQYTVKFSVNSEKYFDDDFSMIELQIYPGPSFSTTITDSNPPRLYPLYFDTNIIDVYTVEWDIGDNFEPVESNTINARESIGSITYTIMSNYDQETNKFLMRRQYTRGDDFYRKTMANEIENIWQKGSKHDLFTVLLETKE